MYKYVRAKKKEWSKNLSKSQFPQMLHMGMAAESQFLVIA